MIRHKESTVYFVEEPLRHKEGIGMVRRVNLSPAEKFGKIKFLLDWSEIKDAGEDYRSLVWKIRQRMEYTDADYIGCIGSMPGTSVVVMIAAEQNGGRVRMLEWDNDVKDYVVREVDINTQPLETESR